MDNKYNNIEIPSEIMEELDNSGLPAVPKEVETINEAKETTMSEEPETATEEPVESETVSDTEVVENSIEIDGENYNMETIKGWMKDSQNKSDWSKSNTEKAQKLSQWNKLSEKINSDDDFRDHIKDFFFDNPDEIKSLGLDGELPVAEKQNVEEPPSELEARLENLEKLESDRIMETRIETLDLQLKKLEDSNPSLLGGEKSGEFLDFAEANAKRFVQNGLPDLNLAFKEWSYDAMQSQLDHYKQIAENKTRNTGKVINTSEVGAKEAKAPKKYKTFREISVSNPDVAKYFE